MKSKELYNVDIENISNCFVLLLMGFFQLSLEDIEDLLMMIPPEMRWETHLVLFVVLGLFGLVLNLN